MNHVPAVVIIFLPDIIITTATMKLALSLALVSSAAAFTCVGRPMSTISRVATTHVYATSHVYAMPASAVR